MNARVVFFTDSYHEVNGVAHTSRHFDAFVRHRGLPFLNIHAGPRTEFREDGPVWTQELKRGHIGFALEQDMSFDLLFMRYKPQITELVKRFKPDVVHITGPSDVGMLGALVAHQLKVPLVASWHTNLHEFGARRLSKLLSFLPPSARESIANFTEHENNPSAQPALLSAWTGLAGPEPRAGRALAAAHRPSGLSDAAGRGHGALFALQAESSGQPAGDRLRGPSRPKKGCALCATLSGLCWPQGSTITGS